MKIRSGFVSNSSSSSFVVAINPGEAKLKLVFEIDLEKLLGGDEFTDVAAWKKEIEENYGCNLDEPNKCDSYEVELFEKGKVALEAGKTLLDGRLSNEHDDPLSQLLYDDPRVLVKAIEESGLDIDVVESNG
jgi:hypothetical protein